MVLCDKNELSLYGANAVQYHCKFGTLVKASMDGKRYCFKKPLYQESMLSLLCAAEIKMNGMIQYSSFNNDNF